MKIFARFLSYVLHPVFMPLVSVFILFQLPLYYNFKYSDSFFNYIYVLLSLNLIAIPLLVNFYMKRKKMIKSMEMNEVGERVLPYLISCIFYTLTYFLLKEISFPDFYLAVFQAATLTIFALLLLALLKQKTSAHLAGIGGICGMLISIAISFKIDTSGLLIVFVLLSGLAGFSRLALNAHKPIEVILGFLLGLGLQLFITLL